jgi:hypothetical protein
MGTGTYDNRCKEKAGDIAYWLNVCLACTRLWIPSSVPPKKQRRRRRKENRCKECSNIRGIYDEKVDWGFDSNFS